MENNPLSELNTIWDEAEASVEQGVYGKAIEIYKYILIRYAEDKGKHPDVCALAGSIAPIFFGIKLFEFILLVLYHSSK